MHSQDSLSLIQGQNRRLLYKCYTTFLVICIIALSVSGAFLSCFVLYGPARKWEKSYDFSFNESRVLNYSSTWCSNVAVDSTPSVNKKLYLLEELPVASDHDAFNIRHSEVLYNTIKYYEFHLYPGSHVNITACAENGYLGIATILTIRGKSNFRKWQDSLYTDYSIVDTSFKVSDSCDNSSELHRLISKVPNEEDYYLVFFTPDPDKAIMIEASFQFYRTKLLISNPLHHCTASDGKLCYLDVPYEQNYPLVVSIENPKSTADQDERLKSYSFTLKCHDRYSLYYAIGSVLLVLCLLMPSIGALLVYKIGHKFSSSKYARMSSYQTF